MEVFVAYCSEDEGALLANTMEAWAECDDAEPVGIQANPNKYELSRRIAADRVAEGRWYILADIGCVPEATDIIRTITGRLSEEVGMYGLGDRNPPGGIRVCQRGVIKKWLTKKTNSYDREHADSVRLAGKKVELWPDITFRRPLVS